MNWKRYAQICLMGAAFLIGGCGMGNQEEPASSAAAIRQEQAFPVVVENYDSQGNGVATTYESPRRRSLPYGRIQSRHCWSWGLKIGLWLYQELMMFGI